MAKTRLLNVRLDDERQRKAKRLREQGITLADVVRDAIDVRYEALATARDVRSTAEIITHIFKDHPDPADLPARDYDVHDRAAARAAITRKVRKGPK
jgi:hypothetical protein